MRDMKDSGVPWIGKIPSGWEVKKVKYIAKRITKGSGITKEEVFPDGDMPCVRYGEIYTKYNNSFKECYSATKAEIHFSPQYFSKGDILIAGTGELVEEIGKGIAYLGNDKCMAGGDIIILTPIGDSIFMNYALNSSYAQAQKSQSKAKLKVVHISPSEIGEIRISLPLYEEQKRIADFLDAKCAEINSILEKTRTSIDEYKKLKQSVITEAITKGIRGNRPKKDSGVEWIGMIPNEWKCLKIKHCFSLRDERNTSPMEEVRLLSLYTELGVFPHGEHEERGNKAVTVDGYKIVQKNDIVVNIILAWMGAIGLSDYDGVTSPAYDIWKPNHPEVVPRYYHYVFRTRGIASECYKYGRGIMMMRWRTYSDEFGQIYIPFPSMAEQQEIVDFLDEKGAIIDSLIASKEALIAELESYKKSLIYEYVTGKKWVPVQEGGNV